MKGVLFAALIFSTAALAGETPTVTLTQDQLARLIHAEQAKAIAGYIESEKTTAAQDVYDALQAAFAPKQDDKKPPSP